MSDSSTTAAAAATGNGGEAQAGAAASTENASEVKGKEATERKERTQRDLFYERHKKDYPDDDDKDEDLVYRRINERNAEYDKLKQSDSDFRKVVHDHPQFGGMFLDAIDGKSFMESFLGRFSKEDIMAAYDDPEMAKQLSERHSKYVKDEEDSKRFKEESDANALDSAKRFSEYCKKNGIGDDEALAMWNEMLDIYDQGCNGKFSDRLFDIVRKAANYDGDVESARKEGELAGHNAKVKTTLAKGSSPKGIPPTFDGGQGAAAPEPKPKEKKKYYNPFRHEWVETD